MKTNLFLRSTLRQPVKTAMLLLVTALITFAFVARVSEYLLVKQETERLESYYTAVGVLNGPWLDTSEAAAYLEAREDVELVDTYRTVPGVMLEEFCNADVDTLYPSTCYYIFYGILHGWDDTQFYFTVDKVLTGYPEYIQEGRAMYLCPISWEGSAVEDPDSAYAELEQGERYLVVGYYSPLNKAKNKVVDDGDNHYTKMEFIPLRDNGFFLPVPEGQEIDWSDPAIRRWLSENVPGIRDSYLYEIEYANDAQHALNMIAAKDMTILPELQTEEPDIYLVDGRWLAEEDDAQERRVCVIHAGLAKLRDLTVGDTLEIKLRDIPAAYMGYFRPMSQSDWNAFHEAQSVTDTYEIVGIFDYVTARQRTIFRNNTYIPASVVPDTFINIGISSLDEWAFEEAQYVYTSNLMPQPDQVSFKLTSPEAVSQFMAETRTDLAVMGFEAEFWGSGWDAFQTAAQPMRRSALLSVVIFTGILLTVLCLAVLIYFRMRRKDLAIARAMGVPALRCAAEALFPLVLLGVLGIGFGSWLGWKYTLDSAAEILSPISELGGESAAALSTQWLAVLSGGVLVLLMMIAAAGALFLTSRPVLTLIQGGALIVWKKTPRKAAQVSEETAVPLVFTELPPLQPAAASGMRKMGAAHVLRFVWQYIARSKLRTVLSILLAAGFTIGLAAIRLSIVSSQGQIDWLYENTAVEAELVRADTTQSLLGSGFLRQTTIDTLLASEYVTDAYVEGSSQGVVFRYVPGMEERAVNTTEEATTSILIRAFEDEAAFLSPAGSGRSLTVTYFDGWDGSLFAQAWTEGRIPIVVPKDLYVQFGKTIGLAYSGAQICEVAGYYEGKVVESYGGMDPVLMSLRTFQSMNGGRVSYCKAHVTLDPSLNRELDRFTEFVTELSATQGVGIAGLRAVIWDEELRLAVAPLENSVELMRVLYPVTLILSLLVAAGIAVLFVMTSAKEAAIMRVLGTSKLRSQLMLALQTVFTSAAGLLVGVLGILAYTGRTRPDLFVNLLGASALCAMLYLLAAVLGAAASASVVTARNPLELLQVKE